MGMSSSARRHTYIRANLTVFHNSQIWHIKVLHNNDAYISVFMPILYLILAFN